MNSTCIYCGVEYELGPKKRRYCTSACRNRQLIRPRPCLSCKVTFEPKAQGAKYCSKPCRAQGRKRPLTCKGCGGDFSSANTNVRFCSRACIMKHCLPPRPCVQCSKEFIPWTGSQMYCSKKCNGKAQTKKRVKGFMPKPCASCGTEYLPKIRGSRFCSEKCRRSRRRIENGTATLKPTRSAAWRIANAGMAPEEERKMLARLKRRALDGVAWCDLEEMYPAAMIQAVIKAMTEEERQQRRDASDVGVAYLLRGNTGGNWRHGNTIYFERHA